MIAAAIAALKGGAALLSPAAWRGIVIAASVVAVLFAAYRTGVNGERKRGEAANLRAQIAAMQADAAIARQAVDDADQRSANLEKLATSNAEKVRVVIREAEKTPASCGCRLDAAAARRLQSIRR